MPKPSLAVLIDAENIAPDHYPWLRARISELGEFVVQRLFGDFSGTRLAGWRAHAMTYGLQPILQLNGGKGKNSTDIALAIHAMDLMHGGKVGGICIISSDRDFAPLAQRLREGGLLVYGIGDATRDTGLSACCTQFIALPARMARPAGQATALKASPATMPTAQQPGKNSSTSKPASQQNSAPTELPDAGRLAAFLRKLADESGEDCWIRLSVAGAALRKHEPAMANLICGNGKLLKRLTAMEIVDVKRSGDTAHIRAKAIPAVT